MTLGILGCLLILGESMDVLGRPDDVLRISMDILKTCDVDTWHAGVRMIAWFRTFSGLLSSSRGAFVETWHTKSSIGELFR